MSLQERRPNIAPEGTGGASWEQILAADPDHEKHLETAEGRYQAILNLVKNGGMVLEVMVMDRTWRSYKDITSAVNKAAGVRVNQSITTLKHLVLTVSVVGAAARSDINENDWQLTAFGAESKSALIYVWMKMLEHEIEPMGALSSVSALRKDLEGNILTTPPLVRAKILESLAMSQGTEIELKRLGGVGQHSTQQHLLSLERAGLVNYESVDPLDSFSFFTLTPRGVALAKWPLYEDSRSAKLQKLSESIELAIIRLCEAGQEAFSSDDIVKNIMAYAKTSKGIGRADVSRALNFYQRQGLLAKSDLNGVIQSKALLTVEGLVFVDEVLKPLIAWSSDPKAVDEINTIRAKLAIKPLAYGYLFQNIARAYEKSPQKQHDPDGKSAAIMAIVSRNQGKLTAADVTKELGISVTQVRRIVGLLIESGTLKADVGKMGRKYLSVPVLQDSEG